MVLVVLVVAGIYMPRSSKTQAKNPEAVTSGSSVASGDVDSQNAPSQSAQPQPSSTATETPASPPAGTAEAGASNNSFPTPDSNTTSVPPQEPPVPPAHSAESPHSAASRSAGSHPPRLTAKNHADRSNASSMSTPPEPSASNASQEDTANANADALDDLEHEIDQLSTRAAAVNSGLDHLQQAQSASGYGLRGDMVAKQSSMKNNLSKAQDAVDRGDLARAKKFAAMAQGDVEALEHFLGR